MTDIDVLTEGRRRLRTSAPHITDAQFNAWAENARQYGAEFALTLDGVVARYPRMSAERTPSESAMNLRNSAALSVSSHTGAGMDQSQ